MKNFTLSTSLKCLTLFFAYTLAYAPVFSQTKERALHYGLLFPLSNHGTHAGEYVNHFSLHGIAGLSKGEKGFTIAGITNVITENADGCQIAGISNHIRGYADGFKAAGIVNTYESAKGFQVAGLANIARSNVTGLQIAGFINTAGDRTGTQIAGFINTSANVRGNQVAGFINTAENVQGVQTAGFINVAKTVKGVQLAGFINIADSSKYPVAIINIIKDGEQTLAISNDDNMTTMISFRSGSKKTYGILGIGHNFKNTKDIYSLQFGLGAHLLTGNKFRVNAEATTLMLENFKRGSFTKYSFSAIAEAKLSRTVSVFAGPALNVVRTNTVEGRDLIKNYLWSNTNRNQDLTGIYVGYVAGLQMKL
jgi:hypothetical protein